MYDTASFELERFVWDPNDPILKKARFGLFSSLETLVTSKFGFNLTTASKLQRAVLQAIDGRGVSDELWDDPEVREAFGDVRPDGHYSDIGIIAGIRTGKSIICAALAVYWTQKCDFTGLRPGEIPRVSTVSIDLDLADVVFNHLLGAISASPILRSLLVEKPKPRRLLLAHPNGRPVEIRCVAGKRAGASLVARWSAGCILDEATRMLGSIDGAVVNYDDMVNAVSARIRPGCQIISVGSPTAPYGPMYEKWKANFGVKQAMCLIVKAKAKALNPVYWTDERLAEQAKKNPDAYQTDCLANWATEETNVYDAVFVENAVRSSNFEVPPGAEVVAAIDPATAVNAWTLLIATYVDSKLHIVYAAEWVPKKNDPLSIREVLKEISVVCKHYSIGMIYTDRWLIDALRELALEYGLTVLRKSINNTDALAASDKLRVLFSERRITLPNNRTLVTDILKIKKRAKQSGATIHRPLATSGRHSDYYPALERIALHIFRNTITTGPEPVDQFALDKKRMREQALRRLSEVEQ